MWSSSGELSLDDGMVGDPNRCTRSCSCKPQQAHIILNEPGMKEALDGKLLISILAGVTIAQISAWVLPSTKVIRAMPNTPCKVRTPGEVLSQNS